MADAPDYEANVARCNEMAQQASTKESRDYWLKMAEYWRSRQAGSSTSPAETVQNPQR